MCSSCRDPKPRDEFHESVSEDRTRKVTSQCRECRSRSYFSKRYDTICDQCLQHRPLNKNRICSKCNEDSGLRQCRGCDELLPVLLQFEGIRKICKPCRKLRRNGS